MNSSHSEGAESAPAEGRPGPVPPSSVRAVTPGVAGIRDRRVQWWPGSAGSGGTDYVEARPRMRAGFAAAGQLIGAQALAGTADGLVDPGTATLGIRIAKDDWLVAFLV